LLQQLWKVQTKGSSWRPEMLRSFEMSNRSVIFVMFSRWLWCKDCPTEC
jgi:hypothetical protein